ncbi:MAG TPA: hypothetical protein VFT50_12520 [Baekduia sp.]|nr:hypothetical protein [Baekduia sp.]
MLGFGALLLFEPTFGIWHAPEFFEPGRYLGLTGDPWRFLQGMLVPWILTGAPIGAVCPRLTASGTRDVLEEDYVRTAIASGTSGYDIPLLEGLALWAAALVVVLSMASDLVVVTLDPRTPLD